MDLHGIKYVSYDLRSAKKNVGQKSHHMVSGKKNSITRSNNNIVTVNVSL